MEMHKKEGANINLKTLNKMRILLLFIWLAFTMFLPMLIIVLMLFLPVLPILLLAFPMLFLNENHWSVRPYIWYFHTIYYPIINNFISWREQFKY
jgi:hypothetical protein